MIAVHDLAATDAFYRDVLGFERCFDDGNWTFYRLGAAFVMAGRCPDDLAPTALGSHSYVGYFDVDDVDAMHRRVAANGAEIVKPLCDEPWGQREFGVRSPEGHRWMFGQAVARNLYQ